MKKEKEGILREVKKKRRLDTRKRERGRKEGNAETEGTNKGVRIERKGRWMKEMKKEKKEEGKEGNKERKRLGKHKSEGNGK
jgi:hypothetical protein